jgi:hypothetical protein
MHCVFDGISVYFLYHWFDLVFGILYNVFMFVVVCLCVDLLAPAIMISIGSFFHPLALMLFISTSYLLVFSMVFSMEYLSLQ